MINDKIIEAYDKLTPEEKQRWDIWYKINHWRYPEPTCEEYEQERKKRSMTSSGSWRRKSEFTLSFEMIDEKDSSRMKFCHHRRSVYALETELYVLENAGLDRSRSAFV